MRIVMISMAALAAAAIGSPNAQAIPVNYTFLHEGFDEGAFIRGSFVAEDLNRDGRLDADAGEVRDFFFGFSGNSILPRREWFFRAPADLIYDLDGGLLGDARAEQLIIDNDDRGYVVTTGRYKDLCRSGGICGEYFGPAMSTFSNQRVRVFADVAEPGSFGLLSLALICSLALRRPAAAAARG